MNGLYYSTVFEKHNWVGHASQSEIIGICLIELNAGIREVALALETTGKSCKVIELQCYRQAGTVINDFSTFSWMTRNSCCFCEKWKNILHQNYFVTFSFSLSCRSYHRRSPRWGRTCWSSYWNCTWGRGRPCPGKTSWCSTSLLASTWASACEGSCPWPECPACLGLGHIFSRPLRRKTKKFIRPLKLGYFHV